MTTLATVLTALGSVGGLVGLGAALRVRAQNRFDVAQAQKASAEAEAVMVATARELVSDVRSEMDRKVTGLEREVARLRGSLEAAIRERDWLRDVERQLRAENRHLRERIEALEAQIADLTQRLAAYGATP